MNDSADERVSSQQLNQLAVFRYQLRRFLNFSETEAERFGIAAQQYQLMQVIAASAPNGSASISFLADRMVLRHNSTVELVDRAERAGLVRRVSDERDLRRSLVVLTSQGEEVLHRMVASHLEELTGEAGEKLVRALQDVRRSAAVQRSDRLEGVV